MTSLNIQIVILRTYTYASQKYSPLYKGKQLREYLIRSLMIVSLSKEKDV